MRAGERTGMRTGYRTVVKQQQPSGCEGFEITNVSDLTPSDGQIITVTGCGFGTKAVASPVLYDTFESGTVGEQIQNQPATVGDWDSGAGSDRPRYSDVNSHSGSKSALMDFATSGDRNSSLCKNRTLSKLYMDYWLYVNDYTGPSRNWKPWRLYGDSDNMQLNWVWYCYTSQAITRHHNPYFSQNHWGGPSAANQNWYHFQLTLKESSPGASDGTIRHFINHARGALDTNAIETRGNSAHYDQIRIGHFWGGGGSCPNTGADVYIDNVYIDTVWARALIGNNSILSNCSHTEMFVPSAWSDTEITGTFYKGSFNTNDTVYLFVVNENNNETAGFQITVG